MQHVDSDMDELFRSAAAGYPLQTATGYREGIPVKTVTAAVTTSPAGNKAVNKFNKWILLALLFTVTGICITQWHSTRPGVTGVQYGKEGKQILTGSGTTAAGKLPGQTFNKQGNNKAGAAFVNLVYIKKTSSAAPFTALLPAEKKSNNAGRINESTGLPELSLLEKAGDYVEIPAGSSAELRHGLQVPGIAVTMAALPKQVGEKLKPLTAANPAARYRGFYAGVTGGPQLSQVKAQGFSTTGFDAGVLGGYRFNNRLSVEAGLLYASRYYFSDGRYFNMAKAGGNMPANMQLLHLNSRTSIAELQAGIKIDITRGIRSRWYINPGISSYLLTREANDYVGMVSGAQQKIHAVYKDNRGYLLSSFSISIGNEFKAGSHGCFRIAPYWQIPLKGMGAGLMPVSAAGLHIGFVLPTTK